MKKGPSLPGWAVGLILAVFLVAVVGVGIKFITAGGPLPDSQAPKEAFQAPSYATGGNSGTQATKDGKPVTGGRESNPGAGTGGGRQDSRDSAGRGDSRP